MPVYEYVCDGCGKTSEVMRAMREMDAPLRCEHCGSERTRRALSLFMAKADQRRTATGTAPVGPCGRCGDPRGSCG